MKIWMAWPLLAACFGANAQSTSGASSDAERLRISVERSKLETAQALDEAACYQRFWVNNCLDEVKVRSRDALDDLRRQEIVLNDEARKARAAEQLQKIEDKSSTEQLKQEAEKRAQAVRDFDDRMARNQQKNLDREVLQAGEKAKAEGSQARVQGNQDKAAGRAAKQALAAEERRKYDERLAQAKERQERNAKEKASQTKPPAQPLPVPK